jgi:competence protein ComEC
MFYRQGISVNSIAAAAFFILLVRPLDLWSVGFQLSFAATFAIVLLANQSEKKLHLRARNRLLNWLIGTVIVSIAAQLGTLPLTIYYFGYVSTYFLLTNLIVLPIATFLVPAGLISIALGGSTAGIWFGKITHGLAWLMNHSVGWIESLPHSTLPAHASMGMVVIYYVLLLLLCFTLYDE